MNEEHRYFEDEDGESSVCTQDVFDDVCSDTSLEIRSILSSSNTSTVSKLKRLPKPESKSAEVLQNFLDSIFF